MLCLQFNPLVILSSFTIFSPSINNHFKLKHYMHNDRFPPLHSGDITFDLKFYSMQLIAAGFSIIILNFSGTTDMTTFSSHNKIYNLIVSSPSQMVY